MRNRCIFVWNNLFLTQKYQEYHHLVDCKFIRIPNNSAAFEIMILLLRAYDIEQALRFH